MILPPIHITPASISGCVLFLPHYPSSTTVSGGKVSQSNDLSGSGNNFVQATGANQPTYQTTPPYGVGNNASNVELTNSAIYSLSAQTFAVKFKLDVVPSSGNNYTLFNLRVAAGPVFTEIGTLNVVNFLPYGWLSNYVGSTTYRGANVALDTSTHRIIMTYNGSGNTTNANYQFFLDGASQTLGSPTGASAELSGNLSSIGARNQSGSALVPINGKVYVIAVYNRVLSASEITALDHIMQAM
jgi:hypothetical protein